MNLQHITHFLLFSFLFSELAAQPIELTVHVKMCTFEGGLFEIDCNKNAERVFVDSPVANEKLTDLLGIAKLEFNEIYVNKKVAIQVEPINGYNEQIRVVPE